MTNHLLDDLQARGLIQQTSGLDVLKAHLAELRTLYCGFDPTADSLHIGNLLPLLTLRRFQLAGHRPILLVGGATGLIGDPSGRDSERALNEQAVVTEWAEKIARQAGRYLDFDQGDCSALVVNNLDWASSLKLIDFLRDTGKHFSVNAMIQKESVRARISQEETGISFTEFTYMLMQSLDYVELAKRYQCSLQIGGSDQWGNITAGIDLVRRQLGLKVHALTLPLITRSDGKKFGKSATGEAIWLSAEHTSPYQFYQFWINTADDDVCLMLNYLTLLTPETITEVLAMHEQAKEKQIGQKRLALELTRLVHGEEGLRSAERITQALFGSEAVNLSAEDMAQLVQDGLPCLCLTDNQASVSKSLTEMGLIKNTHMLKDAITRKAVFINGKVLGCLSASFLEFDPVYGKYFLIRFGKRKWGLAYYRD